MRVNDFVLSYMWLSVALGDVGRQPEVKYKNKSQIVTSGTVCFAICVYRVALGDRHCNSKTIKSAIQKERL